MLFFASYFGEVNYAHLSGDITRDGSQADMIASSSNLGDIIIVCRYCFPVLEVLKEDIFSGGATGTLRPAWFEVLHYCMWEVLCHWQGLRGGSVGILWVGRRTLEKVRIQVFHCGQT